MELRVPGVAVPAVLEVEHALDLRGRARRLLDEARDPAEDRIRSAAALALQRPLTRDQVRLAGGAGKRFRGRRRHAGALPAARRGSASEAESSRKRRFHHSKESSDQISRRWLTRPSMCSFSTRLTYSGLNQPRESVRSS